VKLIANICEQNELKKHKLRNIDYFLSNLYNQLY